MGADLEKEPLNAFVVPKGSLSSWKIRVWMDDKTKADVEKIMKTDRLSNHVFYLLSFGQTVSTHPMSEDGDELRRIQYTRSGGYQSRENREIRKDWNLDWDALPLIPLDADMQVHFLELERSALATCHPMQIRQKTMAVIAALARGESKDLEKATKQCATEIFLTGTSDQNHSRSVAVLVHELALELSLVNQGAGQVFTQHLIEHTLGSFWSWWRDECRATFDADIAFGTPALEMPSSKAVVNTQRCRMLQIAQFLGDLFAVGFVPLQEIRTALWVLVENPRSILHLRGLCLMLSRCIHTTGPRLDQEFLLHTRQELMQRLIYVPDDWAHRWRTEIFRMLEKMLDQVGQDQRPQWQQDTEGQAIKQRWEHRLDIAKVFAPLDAWIESQPPRP